MKAVNNEQLEAFLVQLGYSNNALKQLRLIVENTRDFSDIAKHIITLHDKLQSKLSYIALSGSYNYLKIKNEAKQEAIIKEVNDMIYTWAKKYKIELQKVQGKETFYILGKIQD